MNFIKEHFGFILTMVITYVVGIMLIIVQYIALQGEKNLIEVFLNSLIPTTITYVLGCVLVNITELLKEKSDNYFFNIVTCLLVMIYALLFCIYVMIGFSNVWIIIELMATIILLVFNVLCYKEKYIHRNHGLI